MSDSAPAPAPPRRAPALEVLGAFTWLGCTAFGGPVAHLAHFRAEFVERRRWLDDRAYTELVALCLFLPGPASSQVGFALGLQRAGWAGALAAWAGFTLPSALLMILFALGVVGVAGLASSGLVHGLKLAAVAVVAQAVWALARSGCTSTGRAAVAVAALGLALAAPGIVGQLAAIGLGALVGAALLRTDVAPAGAPAPGGVSRRQGALLLGLCAALGIGLVAAAGASPWLGATAAFYQAGALVFGGGHVVLPLLHAGIVPPGWVSDATFVAGYGAAQAVPGPLFTVAAFLGAAMPAPLGGWAGGLVMLVAVFAPGLLLVAGALPFWEALRRHGPARHALAGVNAAVVGLLAAALAGPVWQGAVTGPADAAVAAAAFGLLVFARLHPLAVVLLAALAGHGLAGLVAPG